jgi:hypothetical protein
MLAFGGVADGFVPFDTGTDGVEVELHLASIVMKAVQASTDIPAVELHSTLSGEQGTQCVKMSA